MPSAKRNRHCPTKSRPNLIFSKKECSKTQAQAKKQIPLIAVSEIQPNRVTSRGNAAVMTVHSRSKDKGPNRTTGKSSENAKNSPVAIPTNRRETLINQFTIDKPYNSFIQWTRALFSPGEVPKCSFLLRASFNRQGNASNCRLQPDIRCREYDRPLWVDSCR